MPLRRMHAVATTPFRCGCRMAASPRRAAGTEACAGERPFPAPTSQGFPLMHADPAADYSPMVRAVLLAALETPTHTLQRAPGGFIALEQPIIRSAPKPFQAFTRRAINMVEREGLAEFDQPEFPSAVKLTDAGLVAARQIKAAQSRRQRA